MCSTEFQKKINSSISEQSIYSHDAGKVPKSNLLDIQNTHLCSDRGHSHALTGNITSSQTMKDEMF